MRYEAAVMGLSAGGLQALKQVLPSLPAHFPIPLAIVQHMGERSDSFIVEYLNQLSPLTIKEAEDKESLCAGTVYIAPPGYHLLIESEHSFSLSVDERVNHACPSVDVLFESAAIAYGASLIGVILTGANSDGALGLKAIKAGGGLTIVQNPQTAEAPAMPQAALAIASAIDYVVELKQLAPLLLHLVQPKGAAYGTSS